MNIIVARSDGSWYTRPDTTLEREVKDFYLPEEFSSVQIRKGRWVKLIKSGKAVSVKFTERYIDKSLPPNLCGICYTIYGVSKNSICPYIDGSTYILDTESGQYRKDDSDGRDVASVFEQFAEALHTVSLTMSVRIGDILIIEDTDNCDLPKEISIR